MSSITNLLPPLYGRKWQLQIALPNAGVLFTIPDPNADPAFDPQALKISFEIRTQAFAQMWAAEIVIWNPDAELIDPVLNEQAQGAQVTLSAGYQNGNYGVIWAGPLFQAFLERQNATDLKLSLYCLLRLPPLSSAIAGATIAAFQTQKQVIEQIAKIAGVGIGVISDQLSQGQGLPRGSVVYGSMSKALDDIAEQNNMQWWLDSKGLNMGSIAEDISSGSGVSPAAPIVFSPPAIVGAAGVPPSILQNLGTESIIGTPRQTMFGVDFRVLLDPRVIIQKPLLTVQINNSLIQFLRATYGQNLRLLDQNGVYVVVGARYVGDTRDNTWYTDITGVTRTANYLAMLVGASQNASVSYGSPGN